MKRFIGFVRKEFNHILRDKRSLMILFGLPVIQILLFGFAITNEIRDAKIAILDLSKDNVTLKLTQKIQSSGHFILIKNLNSLNDIEAVFKAGTVHQVLVFSENFAINLEKDRHASVQILADATDPNTANSLILYSSSIIRDFQQSLNENASPVLGIKTEVRMWYNPELKGVYLFIPGLITIILMLVSTMMTSISLTREKEQGTMEILLASPMKPLLIIISKVIPYLLLSFLNTVVILLLGYFVFDVPVQGSTFLLLAESTLFIITALSLGILISTSTSSQQVALMISLMGLMLPTIMLSGFIFPIENMPLPLQVLSNIIPAKWFIIIVKGIMLKGADLTVLWRETLILAAFALTFVGLSVRTFKIRLD